MNAPLSNGPDDVARRGIQDHQARVHPPYLPIFDIADYSIRSVVAVTLTVAPKPSYCLVVRGQLAVPNELTAVPVDRTPSATT